MAELQKKHAILEVDKSNLKQKLREEEEECTRLEKEVRDTGWSKNIQIGLQKKKKVHTIHHTLFSP